MDRRKFLRRFGLGAAGLAVGTKVAIELAKEGPVVVNPITELPPEKPIVIGDGWIKQIEDRGNVFTVYSDARGVHAYEDALRELMKEHFDNKRKKFYL